MWLAKRDGKQKPVYHTNKFLHGMKVLYQKNKKLAYVFHPGIQKIETLISSSPGHNLN